jgi:hypothetical protein
LLLLSELQGKSPIAALTKDSRGWGTQSGNYIVAQGYKQFKAIPNAPPNHVLWKGIWKAKTLPKVDIFLWNLAHNNILMGDNLKKKAGKVPQDALSAAYRRNLPIIFC